MQRNPIQPLWWATTSKNVNANRNEYWNYPLQSVQECLYRAEPITVQYHMLWIVMTVFINNDTRATTERVQEQQHWGWIYAGTVYYLYLYTRRLALSAFWRKGPARRWDRFLCPPQLGAQGTCPSCPLPLNPHVRLLRSCCSASRLQYRTDKSTSSHRCPTMASLPTTVTAGQTIRLNHHRASRSSVNASYTASSLCGGVLKYCTLSRR